MRPRQCSRNATRDGWCAQHHPDAEKARREQTSQRAAAHHDAIRIKMEAERKRSLRAMHHTDLVHLLGRILNSSYDVPQHEIRTAYERGRELLP